MTNGKKIFIKVKQKISKKKEEKLRSALDGLHGVMRFINLLANVPGLEFTNEWKGNGRQAIAAFVNFVTLSSCIYSVWYHFPSEEFFLLTGLFAFNTVVWTKLIVVSLRHDKFMSLVRFIFKVFRSNPSGPREHILAEKTKLINYHLVLNFGSFLAGYAFYSAFPLYDYIFNGKLTLISPMLVPFIDSNHLSGYFITTGFNVFVVSYCLTICIAVSSLFFACVDAYDGLVSLIECNFGEFDVLCEEEKDSKTCDAVFRNITMGLTDLARFSHYMNDVYGVISTTQVTMSFLVVACALAAYIALNFVSCIGGALVFFTEMIMYCYIGQILDNTNKRVTTVICNAKWYTYKIKYQKDLLIALYIAQNMQPIRLAKVCALNFATGLQITKNIYTLIMFMLELFD